MVARQYHPILNNYVSDYLQVMKRTSLEYIMQNANNDFVNGRIHEASFARRKTALAT